jgi:hypothetical protein
VWAELRRELEDVGISAVVVEERHDFIVDWLKNALADGLLEENARVVGIDDASIGSLTLVTDEGISTRSSTLITDESISIRSPTPISDEGISIRNLTPTHEVEQDSSWYTALSDLSLDISEPNTVGHGREAMGEAMSAATSAFDADVQRRRNEHKDLDSLAASTMYSLPSPSPSSSQMCSPVVRRRRTFGFVKKLFQKQTAIVQAASDGDIDRVARLISIGMDVCYNSRARKPVGRVADGTIGMDVNAVEGWGWSALSMSAYGGHKEIARLLLDHGANIDNVDVDGDTPKSLAAQRGHADLLTMLEEEEAIRKLRASETKQ